MTAASLISAAAIISEARSWLGVPFVHQGRSRAGVDCAGLVICIGRELGFLPPGYDITGYDRHPDGTMLRHCDDHLVPAPRQPGGIVVMRFDREPQHLAILADYRHGGLSVIHALSQSGRVVEHRLDAMWLGRIVRSYTVPGVA